MFYFEYVKSCSIFESSNLEYKESTSFLTSCLRKKIGRILSLSPQGYQAETYLLNIENFYE